MVHYSRSRKEQRAVRACAIVGSHRKGALSIARRGGAHTGGRAAEGAILLREGEACVGLQRRRTFEEVARVAAVVAHDVRLYGFTVVVAGVAP
eukprot:scaffold2655_cov77-Phaeocystis_antarctica.AAC.4